MANTIKHKRGSGSNPSASDLAVGELAIRTDTGVVFTKKDDGTVAEIAGGGAINDLTDAVTNSSGKTIGLGTSALAADDGSTNLNTALGYEALKANTSGSKNTAVGYTALKTTTTTSGHTAVGYAALSSNTSGTDNTAVGYQCLEDCDTGSANTGLGYRVLEDLTSGGYNTCIGMYSGTEIQTGGGNTALGQSSLYVNISSHYNTSIGYNAHYALTNRYNVALGAFAANSLTTGENTIVIGYNADASSASASNEITLGNDSITSFRIPGLQSGASNGQVLTYNSTDGDLELADVSATVANGCIYENSQTISSNYTISTNKNAMSAGPITVNASVTVTIPSGSTYTIV